MLTFAWRGRERLFPDGAVFRLASRHQDGWRLARADTWVEELLERSPSARLVAGFASLIGTLLQRYNVSTSWLMRPAATCEHRVLISQVLYQMLRGLLCLRCAHVIHRAMPLAAPAPETTASSEKPTNSGSEARQRAGASRWTGALLPCTVFQIHPGSGN